MKKLLFAVLAFAVVVATPAAAQSQSSTPEEKEDIVLTGHKSSGGEITRSVAGADNVSAVLCRALGTIELTFDEPEGLATVQISSMGQLVSSTTVDTSCLVSVDAPTQQGVYTITVITESNQYTGYFAL